MIVRDKGERAGSIDALSAILDGSIDSISREESESDIASNVCQFCSVRETRCGFGKRNENAFGSGLMLTTNGFVLTAYHVISDFVEDWDSIIKGRMSGFSGFSDYRWNIARDYSIVCQDNRAYPVDVTYRVTLKEYDLALVKAIIFGKPVPHRILMADTNPRFGDTVRVYAYRDDRLILRGGFVTMTYCEAKDPLGRSIKDTYLSSAQGTFGYSGGPMTSNGRLSGVICYMAAPAGGDVKDAYAHAIENSVEGSIGGAKQAHIRELLAKAIDGLVRRK